ncbi:MAG TPA: LLM class flavin-dependent oxidoreductase [Acidimicrobiales bacterium]|nr:LLM class flavin-dependent oxidoreductase [Acidimicrobiales bacterium]
MKLGITVPQFSSDAARAVAAAERAEAAGIDGVFCFDHLWPMGRPGQPALHGMTLLSALAARTTRVDVGMLVARIGVVPDLVLLRMFETIHHLASGRLIAGMGVGDHKSSDEDAAAGVRRETPARRFERAAALADQLRPRGITTWIAGRSATALATASAHADAVNFWGSPFDEVAALGESAAPAVVTWGQQVLVGLNKPDLADRLAAHGGLRDGLLAGTVEQVGEHLVRMRDAGVVYAVCAPLDAAAPDVAERIGAVAEYARGSAKARQ